VIQWLESSVTMSEDVRGLGFSPRAERPLNSINYFQFIKSNVTGARFKPRTSRIQSELANHYTMS